MKNLLGSSIAAASENHKKMTDLDPHLHQLISGGYPVCPHPGELTFHTPDGQLIDPPIIDPT